MAKPTDDELVAFSEHLLYDVQLFFHEARALTRTRLDLTPSLAWEVEMALVESFALRARSLVGEAQTRARPLDMRGQASGS